MFSLRCGKCKEICPKWWTLWFFSLHLAPVSGKELDCKVVKEEERLFGVERTITTLFVMRRLLQAAT